MALTDILIVNKPYKSPVMSGSKLFVLPFDEVIQAPASTNIAVYTIDTKRITFIDNNGNGVNVNIINGQTFDLIGGNYAIVYSGIFYASVSGVNNQQSFNYTYNFQVVENKYPMKKWTVTDVINRTLDIAEPIRKGEHPRFRLNGMRADGTIITPDNVQTGEEVGQAYKFDTVLCPQLSMTKLTLRECLQEIGKVIHGEPRVMPKKDTDGWYYEISYDIYGRGRMSDISKHKPYLIETTHAVESFCSALDSPAENLINTLDSSAGTIVEPFYNGKQTVRTESAYVRVTDGNLLISTRYPVYSISKLEYCGLKGDNSTAVDITAYLFEASEYARLSSYADTYPNAKLYALRYQKGARNIDGLNFKITKATELETAKGAYSIVAVIRKASGNNSFSIGSTDFPNMQFRVTYTPIYNTRVSQTKAYYKDVKYAAGLFFNQQANLVETKYYGENLKGAVARLGNIEKTISYRLYNLYSIPRAGDMFDDEYMISAVAVELLPTFINCTIALTKSFNRISQWIGVSSEKRFSEISETQAVERNVLYREYVVIGDDEGNSNNEEGALIGRLFMSSIAKVFEPNPDVSYPVSCVAAWGETWKGNKNNAVLLPVISSAFGNSVSFSWEYADNYSAGDTAVYYEEGAGDSKISGYFQNTYPYTDPYGRIYYYNFDLRVYGIDGVEPDKLPMLPQENIPINSSYVFSTIGKEPFILRKDNREALQVNVQIDFVTNVKGMIIGSALAASCGVVRGISKSLGAKLYVFDAPLDKFIDHVEGNISVNLKELPSADVHLDYYGTAGKFYITIRREGDTTSSRFPASGKAWAIVTEQTESAPQMVENERGEIFEQTEVKGGDVLIARNMEFSAGDDFPSIYFTPKREIFDKTVWKDKK